MARPISESIDYFSLDVDMDQDDKVAYLESKHGFTAFGVVVRLLMRIYKNGYFTTWTEREQYLFARNINVDIMLTKTIVNDCINDGFFNKNMYERYGILTSHGIQVRYMKAVERRKKVAMIQEYFLVNPSVDDVKMNNVTLTRVNGDINPDSSNIMSSETPQSKVKESKVKESKPTNRAREDEPGNNVGNEEPIEKRLDGSDLYPSGNGGEETPSPADNNSSVESESSAPGFLEFWNAYPRRSGMNLAIPAFDQLLSDRVDPTDLVAAAKRYGLKVMKDGLAEKFIKMPHTFLAAGVFVEYAPKYLANCQRCQGIGYSEQVRVDGSSAMAPCSCVKRFEKFKQVEAMG